MRVDIKHMPNTDYIHCARCTAIAMLSADEYRQAHPPKIWGFWDVQFTHDICQQCLRRLK